MSRVERLETVFVDEIPEVLEDGILYVSHTCKVALHNCACGCGEEVSTPLVRTEYSLTMEGDDASIWPSVGNHDFACASHYIIKKGRIVGAGQMSRAAIEKGRQQDRELKRPNVPVTSVRRPSIVVQSLRWVRHWLGTTYRRIFG